MSTSDYDAIDLLTADHRRVSKLFKDFEQLKDGEDLEACMEIVESACAELKIHSMLELEIFYPSLRTWADETLDDLLNEADVEHESVELLIEKLAELDPSDPMYAANFVVLAEYVAHHVEEEERELFPRVRKIKDLDLEELGLEMQARKDELLEQIGDLEEDEEDLDEPTIERDDDKDFRRPRFDH
jgi:hemerythrin superfamily protein